MYVEFDQYITEFSDENSKNDFWYDVGSIRASDILSKFTQADWEILFKELNNKAMGWKYAFAYCLGDSNDINELKALLLMIETDDDELIELCVDSLRSFVNSENKHLILKNKSLTESIKSQMNRSGNATKAVFDDFLKKLNN